MTARGRRPGRHAPARGAGHARRLGRAGRRGRRRLLDGSRWSASRAGAASARSSSRGSCCWPAAWRSAARSTARCEPVAQMTDERRGLGRARPGPPLRARPGARRADRPGRDAGRAAGADRRLAPPRAALRQRGRPRAADAAGRPARPGRAGARGDAARTPTPSATRRCARRRRRRRVWTGRSTRCWRWRAASSTRRRVRRPRRARAEVDGVEVRAPRDVCAPPRVSPKWCAARWRRSSTTRAATRANAVTLELSAANGRVRARGARRRTGAGPRARRARVRARGARRRRGAGGAGLGLPLARRLARSCGGDVVAGRRSGRLLRPRAARACGRHGSQVAVRCRGPCHAMTRPSDRPSGARCSTRSRRSPSSSGSSRSCARRSGRRRRTTSTTTSASDW